MEFLDENRDTFGCFCYWMRAGWWVLGCAGELAGGGGVGGREGGGKRKERGLGVVHNCVWVS